MGSRAGSWYGEVDVKYTFNPSTRLREVSVCSTALRLYCGWADKRERERERERDLFLSDLRVLSAHFVRSVLTTYYKET